MEEFTVFIFLLDQRKLFLFGDKSVKTLSINIILIIIYIVLVIFNLVGLVEQCCGVIVFSRFCFTYNSWSDLFNVL